MSITGLHCGSLGGYEKGCKIKYASVAMCLALLMFSCRGREMSGQRVGVN